MITYQDVEKLITQFKLQSRAELKITVLGDPTLGVEAYQAATQLQVSNNFIVYGHYSTVAAEEIYQWLLGALTTNYIQVELTIYGK